MFDDFIYRDGEHWHVQLIKEKKELYLLKVSLLDQYGSQQLHKRSVSKTMQRHYTSLPFDDESAQHEVPPRLFIEMIAHVSGDKLLCWVGISLRGHGRRPSPRREPIVEVPVIEEPVTEEPVIEEP